MTGTGYSLVGDIGGTHARFALVRNGEVALKAVEVLVCRDYESIASAISEYLRKSGVEKVQEACLAVAAHAFGADIRLTNNDWWFNREELRRAFGWRRLDVINDFTAMALGIPGLAADGLIPVGGGPGNADRPRLVIGPGTGLGVSGLVPSENGWIPLVSEGGHVDFAPKDETDMAVLRILKASFGRVSVERILSGQGLLNLYRAHAEIRGVAAPLDAPEKITSAALAGSDPLARLTLGHFCQILGRVAGDAVLTLGATGGVYLCGGILPRIVDFLLESAFRQSFEDKGRMRPLLEETPVYLVTGAFTGLSGAAEALASDAYR